MDTVPRSKGGAIAFYKLRAPRWSEHAAALELSGPELAELTSAVQAARLARVEARRAAIQYKNAVVAQDAAIGTMRRLGAAQVRRIGANALAAKDPRRFAIAALPVPSWFPGGPRRTAARPPVPATNLRATLQTEGAMVLRFDGSTRRGTVYMVERRVRMAGGDPGPWEMLGLARGKAITDDAVPPGAVSVGYRVYGVKGTARTPASLAIDVPLTARAGEVGAGAAEGDGAMAA